MHSIERLFRVAVRERFRNAVQPDGSVEWWFHPRRGSWELRGHTDRIGSIAMEQSFEDIIGNNGGDNPATSSHITRRGGIVNGRWKGGNWDDPNGRLEYVQWTNWPITNYYNTIPGHLEVPNVPSDAWVATEVASRTNPSRPSVSIPAAIAELKHLPKELSSRALRRRNDSVVNFNFGWDPLFRDIIKTFNLAGDIERRIKVLNRLSSGSSSAQLTVFSGCVIQSSSTSVTVSYDYSRAIRELGRRVTTRYDIRGTARWRPSFDISPLSDDDKWRLAVRILTGLEPQALFSTVYQLVPWSWLVDYFSNLGDLISLTNNSVSSLASPVAISRVKETTYESLGIQIGDLGDQVEGSASPYVAKRRDWTRTFSIPGLSFQMPILTSGQVSTLASIMNNYR